MEAFYACFQFRGDAVLDELGANCGLHIFEEFLVDRGFFRDFLLQRKIGFGLEEAEREILEFSLDDGHAEPVGNRERKCPWFREQMRTCLAGSRNSSVRILWTRSASLIEDDADVMHHGQKHLADVFRLARFRRHDVETADFCNAFDQSRDFFTKSFFKARKREFGVLDDVMKQRGGQGGSVKTHIGKDVGDFQQMSDVRVARSAELVAVALCGNVKGAANKPGIVGGAIGAELDQELLKASVDLPLGAVAIEVQGYIGWRRHALVYDGSGRGQRGGAGRIKKLNPARWPPHDALAGITRQS